MANYSNFDLHQLSGPSSASPESGFAPMSGGTAYGQGSNVIGVDEFHLVDFLSAHVDLTGFVSADEGAFFGSHASVLPKVHVGAFAKVGAGSVAVRHVPAGTTVMGVPAKRISPA